MENVLDSGSLVTAESEREMDSPGHLFLGSLGTADAAQNEYSVGDSDEYELTSTTSEVSDASSMAEADWEPISEEGGMAWVHRQMNAGADPRDLLERMLPEGEAVPLHLDRLSMWQVVLSLVNKEQPLGRIKLPHVNTLDDVVQLLRSCRRILVLTGAGVSVSCGIPDFRSPNGIYARLSKDFPTLPDPQAMFDIHFFRRDPRPFFKFAKEIYPGQFQPSPSHRFIKMLEDKKKLLRNYTQNIDTLEEACGIRNVITCHGSFATASCTRCRYQVDCDAVKEDIFRQVIPLCPKCRPEDVETSGEMAVMKPDIVFFGEDLSQEYYETVELDRAQCDLVIVMGSSLKVHPVARIPTDIPPEVPQVLINREPLKHLTFDVELLGDSDVIVKELCERLNWDVPHNEERVAPAKPTHKPSSPQPVNFRSPRGCRARRSNTWKR
ncbi:hypothetical protein HPB48_021473 [Haemaphysalis longicornis]|uniref:protein acetyllysine N-acetyltransferase n=1 Tax=Haemaphysalis longicornis TaxID=44386 RepID=A0A9J6GL60_HAELO|nr:hypothetical protein HPB48_021473 [Haemaphysalis longicornis]